MRGDSVRDFYAKTLAVLGLGLVAGAGALVDYWPVSGPLPIVRAPAGSVPQFATLIQDLDQQIAVPRAAGPAVVLQSVSARNIRWPGFATRPAKPSPVVPASVRPQPATIVADADAPPSPRAVPIETWTPEFLAATSLDVSALGEAPPEFPQAQAPGFFSGALRKTKASLVRTGNVTGDVIADAFKGVVGAFRKVSPFRSVSPRSAVLNQVP